jgi:hypothetical protein
MAAAHDYVPLKNLGFFKKPGFLMQIVSFQSEW